MELTTRFTIRYIAPAGTRYAPTAFDRQLGEEIPVNMPGFHGTGKLVKAEIIEDGDAAMLTIEVTDPAGQARAILRTNFDEHYSYGFNFQRDPESPPGFSFHPIPAMPAKAAMLIGSCGCLHAITEHHEFGCRSCGCQVPIGRLAVKIKDVGDE